MSTALTIPQFSFPVTTLDQLSSALALAGELQEVTDVATCEAAQAADVALNRALKALTNDRLGYTRKLDDIKKALMAQEKEVGKEATEAMAAINTEITNYLEKLRQEKLRREAEAKSREEALAKCETMTEEYTTRPLVVAEPMDEAPVISMRRTPRLVILDVDAIPRKYMLPDEKRLLALAVAGEPAPGTQLGYEETRVKR
jgi:hypothetical protein